MCQGFGDFSGFLCYFVLAKLATSSIRVKGPALIPRPPAVDVLLSCSYSYTFYFVKHEISYTV